MARQFDGHGEVVIHHSAQRVYGFLSSGKSIGLWHPEFSGSTNPELSIHLPDPEAIVEPPFTFTFGTEYLSGEIRYLDAYQVSSSSPSDACVRFSRRILLPEHTGFKKWIFMLHDPTLWSNPVKHYPAIWSNSIRDAVSAQCVCLNCDSEPSHSPGNPISQELPKSLSDWKIWDVMRSWIDLADCKICGLKLPRIPTRDRWRLKAGLLEAIMESSSKVRFGIFKAVDPLDDAINGLSQYLGLPKLKPEKISGAINTDLNTYTLKARIRDYVIRDLNKIRKSRRKCTHGKLHFDHDELHLVTNEYIGITDSVLADKYRPWREFSAGFESMLNRFCIGCGKTYCRKCSR